MSSNARISIPINNPENWNGADGQPMPAGVIPITQTQPQIAQLEIKYNGPLIKDSVVEKFEDLVNIDTRAWNYQHRRVWVKEYACEYYLQYNDGSKLTDWKRAIARMVVQKWSKDENYQAGDVVSLYGKLYFATEDIFRDYIYEKNADGSFKLDENGNKIIVYEKDEYGKDIPEKPLYDDGPSPLTNEILWQVVTGEIETYRYLFRNTNEIVIWTEVRNPIIEVILGDPIYDSEGEPVLNPETGLIELRNKEIIEACVIQARIVNGVLVAADQYTENGDFIANSEFESGGVPYVIRLYSDEECNDSTEKFTGCINIK